MYLFSVFPDLQERLEIAALASQENSHRRDTSGYRVASNFNGNCLEHGVNNKQRPNSVGRSKYVCQFAHEFVIMICIWQLFLYGIDSPEIPFPMSLLILVY